MHSFWNNLKGREDHYFHFFVLMLGLPVDTAYLRQTDRQTNTEGGGGGGRRAWAKFLR